MSKYVLDASAVLALVYKEKGKDVVAGLLEHSVISSVNKTEVVFNMIDKGIPSDVAVQAINLLKIETIDFQYECISEVLLLRQKAKKSGLSLGDMCCIATGLKHKLKIVTADKEWMKLPISSHIKLIR